MEDSGLTALHTALGTLRLPAIEPLLCCATMQPQATEPLEKVDNFFETFYSYIVRDALDVSLAFSAHGRVEDHPNVPGLSQVGMKPCAVRKVI